MVTPVCILRSGGDFRPEHVQRLARMVPGLVALSDVHVDRLPYIPLRYGWPGWWSKMEAYNDRGSLPGDILLIDLDTTILRMPEMPEVTTVLPDFYTPSRMGSGFMLVTAADRARIWSEWLPDPDGHMRRCRTHECWGDQGFLQPIIGGSARWGSKVVSYKLHCANGVPEGTDVVCFHGKPRPWNVPELISAERPQ